MINHRKCLVTGAGGFIGSHLVEYLVSQGHEVRALVSYRSTGTLGWLDSLSSEVKNQIEILRGDIRDKASAYRWIKGMDTVFHLAALISIPYSYEAPQTYVDTNVTGTLNLLEAARDSSIQRFIYTSTSEVYGTPLTVPITEEHPYKTQSPYSASKAAGDLLALSFYHAYQLPVIVVRPFNTYGPRQSVRAIIPTVITQILAGQTTLRLGALEPTRDLLYVRDTVRGFYAAGITSDVVGDTIHLGTNQEVAIGDLAHLIAELMGKKIMILPDQNRIRPETSEVFRLRADYSKAMRVLGWNPEKRDKNGLRLGLAETIEWFSNADNLKKYPVNTYLV